jgi:2,4-diaminopentanoate dehydrogenase
MRRVIQFSTGNVGRHALRTITGDPGVEINAHVGLDGTDHNQGGVIATAARAVNAIEPVCCAPAGLLAAQDLPAAHIRGVMW